MPRMLWLGRRAWEHAAVANLGWLLTALVCLIVGYLFVWQRGFYMDDYTDRARVINILSGEWRPLLSPERLPTFPVRPLQWAVNTSLLGNMPAHELEVRIACALLAGFNALFLGLLVNRLVASRLAALVSGWLFLMPIFAAEAVLWVSAEAYLAGTALTLGFLHATWQAVAQPRRRHAWMAFGTLAFGTGILFVESFVVAVALVPILALIASAAESGGSRQRISVGRTLALMIWPLSMLCLMWFVIYSNSAYAEQRANFGTFSTSISSVPGRSVAYLAQALQLTVAPSGGLGVANDIFWLGLRTLLGSWLGRGFGVAMLGALALAVATWRGEQRANRTGSRAGYLTLSLGLVWCVASLLVPFVPLQMKDLFPRFLYFPLAGASLACGTLTWLAVKWLGAARWERVAVGVAGSVLLFSTVCMLGFAEAFAARGRLDETQIAAVGRLLPSRIVPTDSYLLPVDLDERLFGEDDAISRWQNGVFESPWSGRDAMREVYRRTDVDVFRTGRVGVAVGVVESDERCCPKLTFDGLGVPLDRTIPVTYREGRAYVVESLALRLASGSERQFRFPLATELRRQGFSGVDSVTLWSSGAGS